MPELLTEVERFRTWAANYPVAERDGSWECGYEHWNALHAATLSFIDDRPFASWSAEEITAVLYAVARDNEMEHLAEEIRGRGGDLLIQLAEASLSLGESDAKWQLASELGHTDAHAGRREHVLLTFARDEIEYVRRCALQALARTQSPNTEAIALEAWTQDDNSQQHAQMMALSALHQVGSPRLASLLDEAERDARPHLSAWAAKIRRGDVDL